MRRIEKRGAVNVLCDDDGDGCMPATRAEIEFFVEIGRLRAKVASLTAQLQSGESFHAVAVRQRDAAWKEIEALRADAERLTGERDVAIGMLAYWCVAVDHNGTGWDDWDEHYKDAMYRPCLIRGLLDSAIDDARTEQGLTNHK